jgi:hypothetical protein
VLWVISRILDGLSNAAGLVDASGLGLGNAFEPAGTCARGLRWAGMIISQKLKNPNELFAQVARYAKGGSGIRT